MTGTRNIDSSSAITVGGNAEELERMKRSRFAATMSGFLPARARIAWCIVGTAVYQVGCTSDNHPKNLSALNPGEHHTAPPTESGASSAAIRPWMWNSGITHRPRSCAVSASDATMLRAEAHTFACASGTILERDVAGPRPVRDAAVPHP